MIFFLLILLLIGVRSSTIAAQGQFNKSYLSKTDANNIKGIFVILIILVIMWDTFIWEDDMMSHILF